MADREKESTADDDNKVAASSCYPDPSDSAKPVHDDTGESPSPQSSPDLKSVLVTSVLNLETLDVDLYR